MTIRDWPRRERPRDKLLSGGPGRLSDAELLAVLIGHGTARLSAVDIGRDLLGRFGGLRALLCADRRSFCASPGVGPVAFATLQAAIELNQRKLREALEQPIALSNPAATREFLNARLCDLPHELFCCLLLDNRHRVIRFEELFRGTIDGASVYPREVVKLALAHNAAALILAHNHPSGVAEPSDADRLITRRLADALGLVDIRVLDHFVVGAGGCVSFAERGLL